MNWLKKLLTDRAKAPLLRELDRAIAKLKSGQSVREVVVPLRRGLLDALRGKLPEGIGQLLLDIVLAGTDWEGLVTRPAHVVEEVLVRLRTRVEGARL
jgi:hypothetical protein